MTIECPNHEGNFDCTPFCRICEGTQEVTEEYMAVAFEVAMSEGKL